MIVHIINRDRFTAGYINYMKLEMSEFKHAFVYLISDDNIELVNYKDVYEINSYKELLMNKNVNKLLHQAEKVIISGVFNVEVFYCMLPNEVLKKTCLHFWGGDFYQFRDCTGIKKIIHKYIMKYVVARSRVISFLIKNEYEEFVKIFKINKQYTVAEMPYDLTSSTNYDELIKRNSTVKHRVLVGNSATASNNHKEVFLFLQEIQKNYGEIEVCCPLSYGDTAYKQEVIEEGKKILGSSFVPVVKPMPLCDYLKFLSSCEIAIFNNDRQQAMGNIYRLLFLGKKVYIRKDTPMWNSFKEEGFLLSEFPPKLENEDIFSVDNDYISKNIQARDMYVRNIRSKLKEEWLKTISF